MKNEMHPFFSERNPKEERPVVKPFVREKGELYPGDEVVLERVFYVGEKVNMKNNRDKIVGGWKIGELNEKEGYAILMPESAEDITEAPMTHRASLKELAEINIEKPKSNFANAANFEELYAEIDHAGELQGSKKSYSAKELKELIEEARGNPLQTTRITNTDGLRDRVIALIQEELAHKIGEPTNTEKPESEE